MGANISCITMTDTQPPEKTKKIGVAAIVIACVLVAAIVAAVAGLTFAGSPTPDAAAPQPATPMTMPETPTGSLEVNGEPGYTVYLDGTRLGTLAAPTQTFAGIAPGTYTLTVERDGVTGSMPVAIEQDRKTSASIGISKNQVLLRMAKVLNRNHP